MYTNLKCRLFSDFSNVFINFTSRLLKARSPTGMHGLNTAFKVAGFAAVTSCKAF
jgi:hypothetical protein